MRYWLTLVVLVGCGEVNVRHDASGGGDTSSADDSSTPVCGAAGQSCCANSSCGANLACTAADQVCRAAYVFVGGGGSDGMAYVARGSGSAFTADPVGAGTASAIWGTSKDDVWVVATYANPTNGGQASYARHWNGSVWETSMPFPDAGYVYALWGNAVDNYWAFTNGGGAYHWNGQTWGTLQAVDTGQVIIQAWGSTATNLWAIASNRISHWDGSGNWTETTRADFGVYSRGSITGRRATGEWWAGGLKLDAAMQPAAILHGTGTTLTGVTPIGNGTDCHDVRSLWAGPDDVWAVTAATIQAGMCSTVPKLYRYTNNTWTAVPGVLDAVRYSGQMWGTSNKDIYLPGKDLNNGTVLFHYNGTSWTGTYMPTALTSLGPTWGAEGLN